MARPQDSTSSVPTGAQLRTSGETRQPSLKARAIAYLSRREHSRRELARKLEPHASSADQLEKLLDWLVAGNWQSDQRFAHSLINRRGGRYGWRRIAQELQQHGIDEALIQELAAQQQDNEYATAYAVWEKKYKHLAQTPKDYAKQQRFLASRGFNAGVIRQILGDIPWEAE